MATGSDAATVWAHLYEDCLVEQYRYSAGRYEPIAAHAHAEWQLGLTPDLPGHYHWRGGKHRLPPDRVIVVAPAERHATRDEEISASARYFMLYIPEARVLPHRLTELISENAQLYRDLWRFHTALDSGASRLETDCALTAVVQALKGRQEGSGGESGSMDRVRERIEDAVAGNIGLNELAALAGMTPAHLCRAFRNAFGLPPHAYQTQARIRRAKSLLMTGLDVDTVAREVGFYDYSHFARRFQRLVGVTPAHYRRLKNVQDTRRPTAL
jgi:AraC-like DNA-binding protein